MSSNNKTLFKVNSSNVKYTEDAIFSQYTYQNEVVENDSTGTLTVTPTETTYMFKTSTKIPKLGVMIVGLGGNNGSTLTGAIIANRENITWRKTSNIQTPNYFGSLTQASTLRLGADAKGKDVYIPFSRILPMVDPNDIVIGGWDINNANLADAMERAEVFDWDLQQKLRPYMEKMVPLPSVYYPDFIAANQQGRANNLLKGTKKENVDQLRRHIRDFKKQTGVDKVIVCWSANTERYAELIDGVNNTADNLMKAIADSHPEVSPSTVFAVACILEGVPFINGSPQNTFVPGVIELAETYNVFIGGDDFKSGQTKIKSVLIDFLVGAGIKPLAVTSYNHLGNNDGKNLSSASQFRSKEISKSNVIDDMVESNSILYKKGEHPDHTVVIKYVKSVGDSKRALDEYYSEIFMGGRNTIAIHNTCEDSLLASPLILDLVILTELISRITFKKVNNANQTVGTEVGEGKTVEGEEKQKERRGDMETFYPVLSLLSYLLKAPLVKPGAPVVNALFRQRMALENIFRACVGLAPQNEMLLEHRMWSSPQPQQQKLQLPASSFLKEATKETSENVDESIFSDHGNRSKFVRRTKVGMELDNVNKNC